MAKQAYVWDGSQWQALGLQVPNAPYLQKYGSETVTASASPTSKSVTYTGFTSAPKVFLQITADVEATIVSTSITTSGFTAKIYGPTSGSITFDWYAVQPAA